VTFIPLAAVVTQRAPRAAAATISVSSVRITSSVASKLRPVRAATGLPFHFSPQ
jgi:hypothetical protein